MQPGTQTEEQVQMQMQMQNEAAPEGRLIGLLEAFRQPDAASGVSPATHAEWLHLVLVGAMGAAVFGLATALFGMSALQLLSSMLKLPVLIFATTLVCFPMFF